MCQSPPGDALQTAALGTGVHRAATKHNVVVKITSTRYPQTPPCAPASDVDIKGRRTGKGLGFRTPHAAYKGTGVRETGGRRQRRKSPDISEIRCGRDDLTIYGRPRLDVRAQTPLHPKRKRNLTARRGHAQDNPWQRSES